MNSFPVFLVDSIVPEVRMNNRLLQFKVQSFEEGGHSDDRNVLYVDVDVPGKKTVYNANPVGGWVKRRFVQFDEIERSIFSSNDK